jgi:hypothetical protein
VLRQELGEAVLGVDRAVLREGCSRAHERMAVLELDREPSGRTAQVNDVRAASDAAHRRRELRVLAGAPDRAPALGDGAVDRRVERRPPRHAPAVGVARRQVAERGEVDVADRIGDRERAAGNVGEQAAHQ